ncbi:hypothetical protein HJG60_008699 [Phyllostomus discolor]|uniref:Uncharacterized protein n=1 Tax=Phyllostomus discolor TaxID=89673 RepID=A0A834DKJ2_9CHIR|nr:hypothetical protein HJG60_008699 [Phyllostomus discolor]
MLLLRISLCPDPPGLPCRGVLASLPVAVFPRPSRVESALPVSPFGLLSRTLGGGFQTHGRWGHRCRPGLPRGARLGGAGVGCCPGAPCETPPSPAAALGSEAGSACDRPRPERSSCDRRAVPAPREPRRGRVLTWRLTWPVRLVLTKQLQLGKQIPPPGSRGGVWSSAGRRCTEALPPRQVLLMFRGCFYAGILHIDLYFLLRICSFLITD